LTGGRVFGKSEPPRGRGGGNGRRKTLSKKREREEKIFLGWRETKNARDDDFAGRKSRHLGDKGRWLPKEKKREGQIQGISLKKKTKGIPKKKREKKKNAEPSKAKKKGKNTKLGNCSRGKKGKKGIVLAKGRGNRENSRTTQKRESTRAKLKGGGKGSVFFLQKGRGGGDHCEVQGRKLKMKRLPRKKGREES